MNKKSSLLVESWIKKNIIDLNLCPFARDSYAKGHVLIKSTTAVELEKAQKDFLNLFLILQKNSEVNILFYFSKARLSFYSLLDFIAESEANLDKIQLGDSYKLIAFHPEFRFKNTKKENRLNLVNSSPYPAIHILPTYLLDRFHLSIAEAKAINLQNEKKLKSLSIKELEFYYPWVYPRAT
jgi:hypothetical protein